MEKEKIKVIVDDDSFLSFVFSQMELLDNGHIDIEQAKAQAALARQANIIVRRQNTRPFRRHNFSDYAKEAQILIDNGVRAATIARMCNVSSANVSKVLLNK